MENIFFKKLDNFLKNGYINEKIKNILKNFYFSYTKVTKIEEEKKKNTLFCIFLDLIKEQIKNPFHFQMYHKKIRKPFDYYNFGIEFLKPLVDIKNSKLLGKENLKTIKKILQNKENVILLANHQCESDPQAISILLEKDFPTIASQIIYVAGERVTTDPLAIPFSMGCDLLCIYSKRYIDTPPEDKLKKQIHNKKTMNLMSSLLSEGGKIIYVAPSGGRDRPNNQGVIEVAPFDPQSLEMFYLMSKKAIKKTHFFPLALFTYNILPPPDNIQIEMGEQRTTKGGKIHAFFEKEIDIENFTKNKNFDKIQKRKERANFIHNIVKNSYKILKEL
ncbi:MAG: hypothetical protein AMS24_00695 [Chlamydiae bacterium SM23_39]|nr:MAG: hypothetical protein AMS24_00695 [Chlamydiae bacterium SM23_39]